MVGMTDLIDRGYQRYLCGQVAAKRREGYRRILVQSGTGTGKTHMSSRIQRNCERQGLRSLFTTPRRELAYQTVKRMRAMGMDPGLIMAGEPTNLHRLTQVASIDTLQSRVVKRQQMPMPKARLLNVDEAHLFVTDIRMALLDMIEDEPAVVGWTATPAKGDGRPMKELFDTLIIGPSNGWMMDQGYLVRPRYFAPSKPDLKVLRVGKDGDYTEGSAAKAAMKLVGDVVDNWLRIAEGRSTVVFAVNRKHGRALTERFIEAGVTAEFVDGDTPKEQRREIFERVGSGETTVLVNVFVASYGLDIPPLSVCVLARPTKSLVLYHQMVGRVLRPVYAAGITDEELVPDDAAQLRLFAIATSTKPDCIVIDHAGAVDRLGFVEDDVPWTLEGDEDIADVMLAKKRERNEPKEITCPQCKTVFKGKHFCPKCGFEMVPRGEDIPAHKAELVEKKERKMPVAERAEFYAQARGYARKHGKKDGFAAHLYREKFGHFPNEPAVRDATPKPPGDLVIGFVKHLAIKKRYSKKATA